MIRQWISSLAGQLTLFLLGAVFLAQLGSLLLFTDVRLSQEAMRDDSQFFGDLVSFVELLKANPDADTSRFVSEMRGQGKTFWVARVPVVPPNPELDVASIGPQASRLARIAPGPVYAHFFPDNRSFMQKYFPYTPPELFNPDGPLLQMPMPPNPIEENGLSGAIAAETGLGPPPDFPGNRPPPPDFGDGRPPPPQFRAGSRLPPPEFRDGSRPPPPRALRGAGEADFAEWDGDPARPPPGPASGMPDPRLSMWTAASAGETLTKYLVSIRLDETHWLNAEFMRPPGGAPWLLGMLIQAILTIAFMLVFVVIVVRFATRPLASLAGTADRLGRGESIDPVPLKGSSEVQRVTAAFNTMNERIKRFVENRTKMLGAISHDLRTPIAAMRIRAELMEEDENRERMLEILEDMQQLAQSTLTLAKEDSVAEPTRMVDISALVESVCDDLSDVGLDVCCTVQPGVRLSCRPNSLKRGIRNMAENGVKYGKRSRLGLTATDKVVVVTIDDDGPGIPEDQLERVFAPFVRLEESRNRETGGVGLGLAIARTVAESHGGQLRLENRSEGGLRATFELPVA